MGKKHLEGLDYFNHDLIHIFCKSLPSEHEAIQRALKMLSHEHPRRPVILMTESLNFGALPIVLGAPGICPEGFIEVGLNPILLTSVERPPFGFGFRPVPTGIHRSTHERRSEEARHFLARLTLCSTGPLRANVYA